MPIGVQKIEPLSSSEKKWQAIENLVHILLEWTLGVIQWLAISRELILNETASYCSSVG